MCYAQTTIKLSSNKVFNFKNNCIMKKKLVFICFGSMIITIFSAYFIPSAFFQNIVINIGTTFFALGVGLILVNIYLENKAKKGAVKSLFVLVQKSIAEFHNYLLNVGWAKYGSEGFGEIIVEYVKSNGNPQSIKKDNRLFFYDLVKNDREILTKVEILQNNLTELSRLIGWNLDYNLLEAILDARISIGKLKETILNDSDESIDYATEHLLDVDLRTQNARSLLLRLADIAEE